MSNAEIGELQWAPFYLLATFTWS